MKRLAVNIFWFRRDLRLEDNAGLYHALKSGFPVIPIFIFDENILEKLPKKDKRVVFIWQEVNRIREELKDLGSDMLLMYGTPVEVYKKLLSEYHIHAVFVNRDYEPYALKRDREIFDLLKSGGVDFKGYKDQVIFDRREVLKKDETPYTVYTPYMKKWKEQLTDFHLKPYPNSSYFDNFCREIQSQDVSLESLGFDQVEVEFPAAVTDENLVKGYHETRDIPYISGTSRLSIHLRFGTISIRKLSKQAIALNDKYLNELIWREFYQMILYHYPQTTNKSFRSVYDLIEWENNEAHFKLWCEGKTGFPLVDAGMRELNKTGFMHNRVRMVVASFLTKHLLIDWRWGEAYFAEKLLDFDQASNVGGWQWAAGCGVDAVPYFRVFNPTLQQEKFDPDFKYIKKWVPEYGSGNYPSPIVDHKQARARAIERYKEALG